MLFRSIHPVVGGESRHPVEGGGDGLPEVLVVYGQLPVGGLVYIVKVGIEVEQIPVSVGGIAAGGMDQILGGGIGHHGGQQIGGP